jgi:hypothetical protein
MSSPFTQPFMAAPIFGCLGSSIEFFPVCDFLFHVQPSCTFDIKEDFYIGLLDGLPFGIDKKS